MYILLEQNVKMHIALLIPTISWIRSLLCLDSFCNVSLNILTHMQILKD